jgi:hypothetical protein
MPKAKDPRALSLNILIKESIIKRSAKDKKKNISSIEN